MFIKFNVWISVFFKIFSHLKIINHFCPSIFCLKPNHFKAMLSTFRYLSIIGLIVFSFASCKKLETYPTTPHISFKSLQYRDTISSHLENQDPVIQSVITLTFDVKDGDGDLGLTESDSSININLTVYGKSKGKWIESTLKRSTSMPNLEPNGQNKAVYATIKYDAIYNVKNTAERDLPYDTIKCEFYILDRAKHKSNIDTSGAIVISKKLKY